MMAKSYSCKTKGILMSNPAATIVWLVIRASTWLNELILRPIHRPWCMLKEILLDGMVLTN